MSSTSSDEPSGSRTHTTSSSIHRQTAPDPSTARGKAAAEIAAVYDIVRHAASLPASLEGHLRTCRNDH